MKQLGLVLACAFSAAALAQSAPERAFHPVNLEAHVLQRPADFEPGTSWAAVPWGRPVLKGVPFRLDGIIEVTGMGAAHDGQPKPAHTAEIPVGVRASRLHLLHGTGYDAPDGTPIAALILKYADGEKRALPIQYGVHCRNWWVEPSETDGSVSDPASEVGWSGGSAQTDPMRVRLRLFKTIFVNPLPEREIESVKLVSLFSRATPVLVGLTMEQGPAGDLEKARRLAAQAVHFLHDTRAALNLQLTSEAASRIPAAAEVKLTVMDNGRPIPLGIFRGGSQGRVALHFPKSATSIEITALAPGFAPRKASIALNERPESFELSLEPGASIGGFVKSAGGEAVSGATVAISAIIRDVVGQFISEEIGRVESGLDGKWEFTSLPRDFGSLSFVVTHPEYRTGEYEMAEEEGDSLGMAAKARLLAGSAEFTLEPGIAVTGVITGPEGPVSGARVMLWLDARNRRHRETDSDGAFRIVMMEEAEGRLLVQAEGLAPHIEPISIEEGLAPLRIQLERGRTMRGTAVDASGEPIAGVSVRVREWKGLPLDWSAETDEEGRFVWDSAPESPVILAYSKPGYNTEVTSTRKDHAVLMARRFKLEGRVVDADSGEPIESFQITPGPVYGLGEQARWGNELAITGRMGRYVIEENTEPGQQYRFLFEAEGYEPVASPPMFAEGWHEFTAELKKGSKPSGIVKNSAGEPVEGAELVVLGRGFVFLAQGSFRNYDPKRQFTRSDAEGRFELANFLQDAQVIAVHKEHGYAEAALGEFSEGGELILQPWAAVKIQLKLGSRDAGPGHAVTLIPINGERGQFYYDHNVFRKETDENGRAKIEFVPPGQRQLAWLIPFGEQSFRWTQQTRFSVVPGETKQVQIGGTGRPIIGQLATSDPERVVDWKQGLHHLSNWPRPPRFRTQEEFIAWRKSPEVLEAHKNHRTFAMQVAEDGSFRIEDVPPGDYTLQVNLTEPNSDGFSMGRSIGSLVYDVTVEEIPGGQTDEPLDLGTLTVPVKQEPNGTAGGNSEGEVARAE